MTTKAARPHGKTRPTYPNRRRQGCEFTIPGRHFYPAWESDHRHILNDQLLVYDAIRGVLKIQKQETEAFVDADSLVLSIGGTCQSPGTRGVRAAWGVYFGPESPYNASALLDPALPQTQARAEIEALRQALSTIETRIIPDDFQPRRCYIKTHSPYIEGVFLGLGRRGVLLREIEERLEDLCYDDGVDRAMDVRLWCTTLEENREAVRLVADALARPRNGHEKLRWYKRIYYNIKRKLLSRK